MRFFFHHLYHGLAWTYDLVASTVSLGRWQDWGRATLPHLNGTRILELGFGPGHLQRELTQAGFEAIGLDASPQMCRLASRNLRKSSISPTLFIGYAQHLPFANDSFESIVATFPSEYIFAPETLSEAGRVLQNGGRLVVALSALPGSASLPGRAAAWLFRITGQGGDLTAEVEAQVKARFSAGRLKASLLRTEVHQSTVYLVVAEKVNQIDNPANSLR